MPSSKPDRRYRRNLIALLAFVILLILYGSLYPWHFEPLRETDPLTVLLHSWDFQLNRFVIRDICINVVLYMPLGFVAYLVFRRRESPMASVLLPLLTGFALSWTVEMAQAFEPVRQSSLLDVLTNVIGTALGAGAAAAVQKSTGPFFIRAGLGNKRDASALLLLALFAGWQLYPFLPILGRTALALKIAALTRGGWLSPLPVFETICVWYAAGLLLRAVARVGNERLWPLPALGVIVLQFLVIHRQPNPSEISGAIAGIALAALLPPAPGIGAAGILTALLLIGMAPFHLSSSAQAFSWIPFAGFLGMDWEQGVILLCRKCFSYGAAIWLLRAAGVRLRAATALVAVWLGAVEAIQVFNRSHLAEITDPVLALLFGFAIAALSPSRGTKKQFRSRG